MTHQPCLPILSCKEAADFEKTLLHDDPKKTWAAISHAGQSLAKAILEDYSEIANAPPLNILVLLGTGHNAADALLAANTLLQKIPKAKIKLLFALGQDNLKPLTKKALSILHPSSYDIISLEFALQNSFDISIDGILGMSFHPPIKEPLLTLIHQFNNHPNIRFRASVDIPSGLTLKADFSYATGIAKTPLFLEMNKAVVGRIRFLDLGFFEDRNFLKNTYPNGFPSKEFILLPQILNPLKALRPPSADKRQFGHLFILAGSRNFPGALLMSVKSAIQSGVGLVTVFAPESLVASFSAQVPEAMWVPFPETESGSLSLSGKNLLFDRLDKASALLCGQGLGPDPETLDLVCEVVRECPLPISLDANALMPEVFESAKHRPFTFGSLLATPHLGEFTRIAGNQSLSEWNKRTNITTLLKGPISQIAYNGHIYYSTFGGPVLARGGSGDILSGLVGSLLAQTPLDSFGALSKAVVWHGMASDLLARSKGQVAVRTTDLCNFLSPVLHNNNNNNNTNEHNSCKQSFLDDPQCPT